MLDDLRDDADFVEEDDADYENQEGAAVSSQAQLDRKSVV